MGDSYQPIYDAVRSRISNGNIGEAVQEALRVNDIGHQASLVAENIRMAVAEYERPSVLFRPVLILDGSAWIALYGPNIQEGVVGVGDSPEEATRSFDKSWYTKR